MKGTPVENFASTAQLTSKRDNTEISRIMGENSKRCLSQSSGLIVMVQAEVARRKQEYGRYSGVSIFSGKIKCGECGGSFGAKVWHSTDKYRRVIYRCNKKYDGHKCQTPHG